MNDSKGALNEPNRQLVQTEYLISAQKLVVKVHNCLMAATHSAFSIAFLTGLFGLAFNRIHLLSALLCLEAIILSLFLGLSL